MLLVSLKYREIKTVKTVTLYKKKKFFFIKSLKSKKNKLTLTSIYCQLRNMVGQLKKAYKHDSTFSHTRNNSKMFNINSEYYSSFNNKPPTS